MIEKKERPFEVRAHKYCENPKVSVIVPVYKVERYLTQCLNSIVNQTMEELEIIIVDEGDQDRCREIIDYFEAHDSRVVAPHQKNGGYGASCNLGFDLAKGEYIAIVESDDWIEPEMYEEMYAYAKALGADVVKTPYSETRSDGSKTDCPYRRSMAERLPSGRCFSMKEYGALLDVHASLWSGIYRTSYMRENNIRFIQAKGGAYVDVGFRIDTLINTEKVAWLDKPYYNYRVDAIGSTTNNFKLGPMIQRWKEQHEKFVSRQEDYDSYYGPHLILDEYYNTVGWLHLIPATQEEYDAISYNLNFVKKEMIDNSIVLDGRQKYELNLFKESPAAFKKYVARRNRCKNIANKSLSFTEKISNPVLLLWVFVGFLTSNLVHILNAFGLFAVPMNWHLTGFFVVVFTLGICVCFGGKVLHRLAKIAFSIFERFRRERQ